MDMLSIYFLVRWEEKYALIIHAWNTLLDNPNSIQDDIDRYAQLNFSNIVSVFMNIYYTEF